MMFLDPSQWKDLMDEGITTNALWLDSRPSKKRFVIPDRQLLPKNSSVFHGLWIPEIPYQMIRRFTHEGEMVWSVFAGSGTDYKVCELLNRQCIATDLNQHEPFIIQADASTYQPTSSVQLALLHPPYYDIVKYSHDNDQRCGSSKSTLENFIRWFKVLVKNVVHFLDEDRFLILCCGNIYIKREEVPLGMMLCSCVQQLGLTLKSHIIKEYGETKGSSEKNYNINYYRQIKGHYNNFYGDNIFILQKTQSKNNINHLWSICNE